MKKFMTLLVACVLQLVFTSVCFSSTIVDAQIVRHQEGSGECLISSGFPLPKGLVTEQVIREGLVRVVVDGTEVPANVSALRGRHNDGTLRSMLIQFPYSLQQGKSVPARVIIDGGKREFADPEYQRPTLETVKNNNVIFPISADYLVSTNITLRNLLPFGDAAEHEERFYTDLAEDRFDYLFPDGTDESRYEPISGMLSLWCRSGGDIKFWNGALAKGVEYLKYHTPRPSTPDNYCKVAAVANPDGRKPSYNRCGISNNERYFAMGYSYAQLYLLTGWRDFWGTVAAMLDGQQKHTDSQKRAYERIPTKKSTSDYPRTMYAWRYGALVPALMIDATLQPDLQTVEGEHWKKSDWKQQTEWVVNALLENKWDLKWIPFNGGSGKVPARGTSIKQGSVSATLLCVGKTMNAPRSKGDMPEKGYIQVTGISGGSFSSGPLTGIKANAAGPEEDDYRNGMVGTRSWTPRSDPCPNFQYAFTTNFLIDYYLHIKADNRIPPVVKKITDAQLKNIRLLEKDDPDYGNGYGQWGRTNYGIYYHQEKPVGNTHIESEQVPIPARAIAFTLKTSGEETVNGKTYSEWYKICLNTGNVSPNGVLNWQWRHFGQMYGWSQDAPWMMQQESLVDYGPSKMRKPKQYGTIPGDRPDIARES